jgi:hypothetical protein
MKFKLPYSVVILAGVTALLVSAAQVASAQAIDFTTLPIGDKPLPTANSTNPVPYTENGFMVVTPTTFLKQGSVTGSVGFNDNNNQGNPAPGLITQNGSSSDQLIVTRPGTGTSLLAFTFTSVDFGLDSVTNNSLKYTITGYDGTVANPGTPVFSVTGTDVNCCGGTGGSSEDWTTYSAAGNVSFHNAHEGTLGNVSGEIDELVITVTDTVSGGNGYVDNINVFNAPEGGAALLYLLLGGGACFGAMFLTSRRRLAVFAAA